MLDAIKRLLDSNVITEDTHNAIMEAWEAKLTEAREELKVQIREEMATRYEHDKKTMVEALDKMITDGLTAEIEEFAESKKAMYEDRVKFQTQMQENAKKFNNFLTVKLAEELRELRSDRRIQKESMEKLESFVARHLAKEIKEFAQDKQDIVETKVKLVAEASDKLQSLRKRFVANAKKQVEEFVSKKLTAELNILHEDIKRARENSFGRKVFEAFVSEFAGTLFNENAEIRKLREAIKARDTKLKESVNRTKKLKLLVETKNQEIRTINENTEREAIMAELLGPLNDEKAKTMERLLEGVQTKRLQKTYDKYLPAVLNNEKADVKKTTLTESVVRETKTGDRKTANKPLDGDDDDILEIQRLAGQIRR